MTRPQTNAIIASSMRVRSLLLCILAAACLAAHAADKPPIEVASPHFTLVTTAGEKDARHILDNFERMRWMFHTLFPKVNVDPPAPILVLAVRNKKEFQTLEPAEYLAKGQLNLAGYFLTGPDSNFILLRLDGESEHPFVTIYHEYTHLQFRSAEDWMPLWLNEGIAEFFQNTEFRDKQVLLGEPSADDLLYLRQNSLIPLATLFSVDHNSPYYHEENKGSVFYSESWALTHYLQISDKEKGTNRVYDYMARMSRHEDPVSAAQAVFGDLKQLQHELSDYIQQQRYKQFILNSAAAPIDPASYTVRTLTQPQFDADRAQFLTYVGRTDEARTLLTSAMQADPHNAQARETMGFLEFHANNRSAARDWFKQAVELDSQNYLAHYYFAAISIENGGGDAQIESSLRAILKLNPAFAPPYDLLAVYLSRQHDKLDEVAALCLKGVQLDRSKIGYRFNCSNILMMQGKENDAVNLLQSAQTIARSPEQAAMLASQINQIHQFSAARRAAAQASADTDSQTTIIMSAAPVDTPPKHPTEPATGPKHSVLGTMQKVTCSGASTMELEVAPGGKARTVSLYTNDYFKLDLSALGFQPKAEMNPCRDLDGMKAKVQYATSSDTTVDGQIIAIELHK